jgi:hypothetical protein
MKYDDTATDVLTERPDCDICKQQGRKRPAYVDCKTKQGPWAYACTQCFARYGIGLGMGRGQRLLIEPPAGGELPGTSPAEGA